MTVSDHPHDDHTPAKAWSPTIQNLPVGSVLQTRLGFSPMNFTSRIFSKSQEILRIMSQIKVLNEYCTFKILQMEKLYNSTKFRLF